MYITFHIKQKVIKCDLYVYKYIQIYIQNIYIQKVYLISTMWDSLQYPIISITAWLFKIWIILYYISCNNYIVKYNFKATQIITHFIWLNSTHASFSVRQLCNILNDEPEVKYLGSWLPHKINNLPSQTCQMWMYYSIKPPRNKLFSLLLLYHPLKPSHNQIPTLPTTNTIRLSTIPAISICELVMEWWLRSVLSA